MAFDVAILVCTFNRAESLRRMLATMAEMAVPPGVAVELVIIDNNSTDHTRAVCEGASLGLPLRYLFEKNQGQPYAWNRGLEETTAPLLLFTDDDVDVDGQWLAAYWAAAQRHPAAGFFGGPVQPVWETPPPRWFVRHLRTELAHVAVHFEHGPGEGPLRGTVGANMALRRAAGAGLAFDTRLGPWFETQFIKEVRARGFAGVYVPGAVVRHRTLPERMAEGYVRRWFVRDGRAEVRLGQVARDRPWFGVARYYWRQLVVNALRYGLTRWLAPSSVWLPAEIAMARAWGVIAECRGGAGAAPGPRLAQAVAWRWEKLGVAVRRHFQGRSGAAYIRWRWPWPLRKPYARAALRLCSLGGGVGDELMCTPVFREIRRRNPQCRITFLSRYPEMFRANPHLAAVELFSAEGSRGALVLSYLPVLPPLRPLITLMGECVGLEMSATQLDPPMVEPTAEVRARIAALAGPRIVVQPRASQWTPNKAWPAESWRELIGQLTERFEVIEVGTQPLFPGHDFGPRFHSLAGATSLTDFVWIIAQGSVFVGPSSGGMHIANAFRVPSVILFGGYESPAGYGYPGAFFYSAVPCAPCWLTTACPYDLKCLRMIAPETIFAAVCQAAAAG